MNDQERISIIYGTILRLRRGNLHFTDRKGVERAIHVGDRGDDFLDALEFGRELQEVGGRQPARADSAMPDLDEVVGSDSAAGIDDGG